MENLDPRIRVALSLINPSEDNPAWSGTPTALGVLRGVGPETAVWRPYSGANNIREIALHIAFWENGIANRILSETSRVGFQSRKPGWAVMLESISPERWNDELVMIRTAHQRLVNALKGLDPMLFDCVVGKNTQHAVSHFIHGVAEHTTYHTAQIEMLKTLWEKTVQRE